MRDLTVFGYNDREGHCEVIFDDVRVPATNLLGEEGGGFAIAQARLGPGRIHHCMRSIGAAERALELMCRRARSASRSAGPLAEQGVDPGVRSPTAAIEIDQARLLTLNAAWLMDTVGNKAARGADLRRSRSRSRTWRCRVIDRAIQAHGGGGVSQDFPLAAGLRPAAHPAARRRPRRGAPHRGR